MLGELGRKLIEVLGQLDLAAQRPESLRDGTAARYRDQAGDWSSGPLDDDLLATLRQLDQPRQLALCFVHSHADHDQTLAPA